MYLKSYLILFIDSKTLLNGRNVLNLVVDNFKNKNYIKIPQEAKIHRIAIPGYNNTVLKLPPEKFDKQLSNFSGVMEKSKNEIKDYDEVISLLDKRYFFNQEHIRHPQLV
jgi:hypothetical protein